MNLFANLLPKSLVMRVYALYSATLLLFVGIGLGVFYQSQVRQDIEDAQDSATMLVEVVAQVISESAVIGDYDTIKRTLEKAIARSQFSSAAFIDLQGGVMRSENVIKPSTVPPAWLHERIADQLYDVNRNISVGGIDYGVLRLTFAVDNIAGSLWQLLLAALVLALASLTGGLALIWFPLKHWLGTLERVQSFELDRVRGIDSGAELINEVPLEFRPMFEVLANTSNSLRQELAAREQALTSLRALLETMLPENAPHIRGDHDDLGVVSKMIGDLVIEREIGRLALDNQKFALDQHAIVSITDKTGRILYANDRFCASAGYPREEFLGNTHGIVKSGVHGPDFYRELWSTILDGMVWKGEMCNRSKSGELYWFASTIVPLTGPNGQPDQFIGICTDITRRKAAEADLQSAKEIAEAANRAKSEFLANMSHEIRTPMNGIIGMTDLALHTELTAEQRDYLLTVKTSADALLTIINDILDFSKIEAGKLGIEAIPFDLPTLIGEPVRLLAPRADEKQLRCVSRIASSVPAQVIGDPVRLRQILLNLLGNAIKFTEVGEVAIEVAAKVGAGETALLHFAVRDTGIGIPPDKQEHIFEAFAQEDSSTSRRFGGTGLGLSICSRLVELMHGRMWLESTQGVGSSFHFELELPVIAAETGTAKTAVPDVTSTTNNGASTRAAHVLLVEDNAVNQRVATVLLERRGHHVRLAQNGIEALDALVDGRFDVILMDMQMPLMDGLEATREIRKREIAAGVARTPIIAMTANAMQGDREICIEAGMDDYVSKPIRADLMYEALDRWIAG
jgi:PAS domain S-box-containing protein